MSTDFPPPDSSPSQNENRFVSQTHLVRRRDVTGPGRHRCTPQGRLGVSEAQILAITLHLIDRFRQALCLTLNGASLEEMRWWDQVLEGDVLTVHVQAAKLGEGERTGLLVWTVNQSGRCVFSCLARASQQRNQQQALG